MPRTPVTSDNEENASPGPETQSSEVIAAAPSPAQQIVHEATTEALLEQIAQEQDPWTFINAIEDREVPMELRQQYYQTFIALIATRALAEQDALINAGMRIFRYRAQTARQDVEQLRTTEGMVLRIEPSVLTDDFMAEMVHVPNAKPSAKYIVFRKEGDVETHEITDRLTVANVIYQPPQSHLIDIGVITLPTALEPYDEQMDLFYEIRNFVMSYLHVKDEQFRMLIIFYIFLTWIYDKFSVVPYLRAQGDFGAGKSRLLQVVGAVSNRAIMAGGATTASPIFRIMARFKGTLLLDEADFNESELWSDVIKILNIGYQKGFYVLRSERGGADDNFDVQGFDCFGPKVLSTRKRFADQALESRCLSYTMQGGPVPARIPLFLDDEFVTHAQRVRNKLLLWRFRHYRNAHVDSRARIPGLDSRLNQIMLPLLACTDDARLRAVILRHVERYQIDLREDKRSSFEGLVAVAILQRWRAHHPNKRVSLKEVFEAIRVEHGDNLKIDNRKIGQLARYTFGLKSSLGAGITWINISEKEAAELADRYHIPDELFLPTKLLDAKRKKQEEELAKTQIPAVSSEHDAQEEEA